MNEEPTQKKCVNCRVPITRNMYCKTCDAIIYVSWAFDDYEEEPELRLEFINRQRKDNITSGFAMAEFAEANKFWKMKRLGDKIKHLTFGYKLDDHIGIFRRAMNLAESKAEREIKASSRAQTAYAQKEAAKALEEAYKASKVPRGMIEYDTTDDRARMAYVGFDPTIGDPGECPF